MDKGFEVTWAGLWRVVGMLALVAVFYLAFDIVIAVLLAIVISSALDSSVTWLEQRRIPRVIGTLMIFITVIFGLAMLLYTVVPIALSELHILLKNVGEMDNSILGFAQAEKLISTVNESLGQLTNLLVSGSASFIETVSNFIGGIAIALSVFVLAFYLTVDRDGVEKFLREVMPSGYEDHILNIYFRTRKKLGRWLYGQLFLSLSVGVAVFLGLWFIGVKYSLLLGILAGVMEIVPFVGPILSGALAFVIAVSDSWSSGVYTFLLFLLVQQAEGTFLVPIFMRLTVRLHPAVVLISLLIGAKLFGIVGLIIAVPIAVMFQEIMDHWATEKLKKHKAVV
ncbi:MAG: AI-2E family transporter [bacterium]|nr:AI-2E family transporter [bacterium]